MKPAPLAPVLTCLAALAWLAGGAPPCLAHSGDELSAWAVVTPTIDGVLSAGEWIDADVADFTLAYCSESHDVSLYVKNDDTYLYLAVVVRDEEYSNLAEMFHDFANFYFDNNHNGIVEVGEDGLAIRFDNTIFEDTHNPTGVNGWSYFDDTVGGTNDLDGATTHTNPVPDGVGDYTFEYRHPLDTADDSHDFSLAPGDTVGFRFSFPDGETTCQPVGYNWPSSSPAGYGDIVLATEPYLKLLFVPLNWTDTQAAFDSSVDTQIGFFIDAIPLAACPEKVSITRLDVATQNFSTFACGTASIGTFVTGLGINAADYDITLGLVQSSPCLPIAGQSNGTDTVWVETVYDSVAAHEIGHIFALEDEYCTNAAGSTDCRCNDGDQGGCGDTGGDEAATGDLNFLHADCVTDPCDCPSDGSNDCTGSPCCNFTFGGNLYDCSVVDYGICCLGNRNAAGGRAIMSFADVEVVSPGTRAFDVHSEAHFATLPELSCSSPERPIARRIVDVSLTLTPQGEVTQERLILTWGRPTRLRRQEGDYELVVVGPAGKVLWRYLWDPHFDYDGPRYLGVDYSKIQYDSVPVHVKIPYQPSMETLVLRHGGKEVFARPLVFCDEDGVCGASETHETCPDDCPLEEKDELCTDRQDGVCDPDCAPGVDPDCQGECGNGLCNQGEDHRSCPEDCASGGADGLCDEVADERCDPDCGEKWESDPDCRNTCGDGTCASCGSGTDPHACESFATCPEDCPSGGEDEYCDGEEDDVCDPDCARGEDPDCPGLPPWLWLLLLLLLILLVLILIWWSRRGRR